MKTKTLFFILILLSLTSLNSCSLNHKRELTEDAKLALFHISDQYLVFLARGESHKAASMILWDEYFHNNELNEIAFISKATSFSKKYKKIKNLKEHPLLGFSSAEAQPDGNDAIVTLTKKSAFEKVKLKFRWVGAGWLVCDDNLFGDDELIIEDLDN